MDKLTGNKLFYLIHEFLVIYLPIQRNSSPHTIKAYKTAIEQFLDFVKVTYKCKLSGVTFDMLTCDVVTSFLDNIDVTGTYSISTRNHKLKCLKAFFSYSAMIDISSVIYLQDLMKIPWKKPNEPTVIEFMSEEAIKTLLSQPNSNEIRGLRDQFLMILLYDTGARISEVLNLKICDISITKTTTVKLLGKGNKVRSVPIMAKTVEHLNNYLKAFHLNEGAYSNEPLFYVLRKGQKQQMSDDNVRKLLKLYGGQAKKTCPNVPDNVHPHLFRHSRAMHLYQHGMDLTLVSQWLGHSTLETTLIYAHADTEMKRKAIEKATVGKCNIPVAK